MASFRFLHAADLHLDTPFEGLARASEDLAQTLRDASLAAFDALVTLAIDRDVAFVVFAGDIYDGAERGVRAQLRFHAGLARLSRQGIQSFVVHGNHDPVDEGWSAVRQWPEGVRIFGSDGVESAAVERNGERIATVHGISFDRSDLRENLALRYARGPEPGLQIGLLHCNVDSAGGHENYAPCSRDDLARVRLDYWALGHVHGHRILSDGDPWIVYPGNLQGRSPKPSERGAKGACLVSVADDRVTSVELVPLDRVRFAQIEVDAATCSDLPALERAVTEAAEAERVDDRALVVRARIFGRSELRRDLRREGVVADLLSELRSAAGDRQPLLWWDSLEDATRSLFDREALAAGTDFRAALLAQGEDFRDAAAHQLSELALPRTLNGVLLPEATPEDGEHWDQWVASGEELALDALIDEAID